MRKENAGQEGTNALLEQVRGYPTTSGVYLMKDGAGAILYIGKAKNVRARLLSYFRDNRDVKTRALMRRVERIDYVLTESSYEALLLEINLIKQWLPRYNIDLKDGKSYPLIRITDEKYPRVIKTRTVVKDGSRYYGPYIEIGNLMQLIDTLGRLFPLRKCRGALRQRAHPCLHYHIGRCAAPCAGLITHDAYRERVQHIEDILAGNTGDIKVYLHQQIAASIASESFERAAQYRDALQAIKLIEHDQHMTTIGEGSADYIGYAVNGVGAQFTIFQCRDGRLVGSHQFRSDAPHPEEQFAHMLVQYYEYQPQHPERVVAPRGDETWTEVVRYFHEERNLRLHIGYAENDRDRALLHLAMRNSEAALATGGHGEETNERLSELQELLGMKEYPAHIEGIDIAHIGGKHTVGSVVYFRNGRPLPSRYRRFALRTLGDRIDDFEAIREVVARRYSRVINEKKELPNLIVIDGGLGQVNAAAEILASLQLTAPTVVGIAKEREELYMPNTSNPLALPHDSAALRYIVHVRDEAHRFATDYRASKQRRALATSLLREAPHVGPNREKILLRHFKSLREITSAHPAQIAKVCRMGHRQAEEVVEYLRTHSSQAQ